MYRDPYTLASSHPDNQAADLPLHHIGQDDAIATAQAVRVNNPAIGAMSAHIKAVRILAATQ
ncbi:hypothetical protein IQ265_23265 [Nodosilinea sp. LEGE 06152]|uniref:hypothetical protein n=1 Tax=Nodosilinea sp. LEGE 06152 TaxID=2777966 RepID=UPI001880BAAE|nr:hypothetical protein [Nodosilinea sp. LEGE 06152]MBE9159732.1 hypothetical protein [Nodosilinea sp. LEGE 06152]